jgi:glucose/mannose-6-phosphate isomerase
MTLEEIHRIDPDGMYKCILDFPAQVEEAFKIGKSAIVPFKPRNLTSIVITGLGGSAIGGDLLRAYLADEILVPITVNRHYTLPEFVGTKTLVIVSSYSGNTEETISAHKDATKRKAKVLCISTGGEVTELARKNKQPCIKIPGGLQPRAALGYSFFPLLMALAKAGFIQSKENDIKETIALLKMKAQEYGSPNSNTNPPLELAGRIRGRLPIIYSSSHQLDAINLRWRGQIEENAKQLAYGNLLPEMNHNELVGWNMLKELLAKTSVIFLRDKGEHARVSVREEITKKIVSQYAAGVNEVWSQGLSLLTRMFSLIQFGDWVSFYLAILNNQDPTPVKAIEHLKNELAKIS